VDAGVIIAGYKGDPALERRPRWVKDGSFMAFRKLEQLVPEFEGYVVKNGKRWREFVPKVDADPPLNDGEGASLWGARMFGRYRSVGNTNMSNQDYNLSSTRLQGAPLARNPSVTTR